VNPVPKAPDAADAPEQPGDTAPAGAAPEDMAEAESSQQG
jgi:hypothetical protein